MNPTGRTCRLCLQTICGNDFEVIEDITRRMLDKLLLKINLNLNKQSLICKQCVINLEESFNFKSVCLNTELLMLEENKSENAKNVYEGHMLCRLCMGESEIESCTYLNETKESAFVADMIQKYIPELDFNFTQEIKTCEACLDALKSLSSFIMKCEDIEDEIKKYTESSRVVADQINLYDIQQFISKQTINCETSCNDPNSFESAYFQSGDVNSKTVKEVKNEESEEIGDLNVIDINKYTVSWNDVSNQTNSCDIQEFISKSIKKEAGSYSDAGTSEIVCCESADVNKVKTELGNTELEEFGNLDVNIKNEELEIKPEPDESESIRDAPTSSLPEVYSCDQCSFKTKYRYYLKFHSLTHRELPEGTRKCNSCSYVAKHEKYLKRHMLLHQELSNATVYSCHQCPFKTKYKNSIKGHMLTHQELSELTVYRCEICPYRTKHKSSLSDHLLIHQSSLTVAFSCDQCPFVGISKHSLKIHMLTHQELSEETLYSCDQCSLKTKYKSSLKLHVLTHKKKEVYKCGSCPYETKYKRWLQKHNARKHVEGLRYDCENCSYLGKNRTDLMRHMKLHGTLENK